MRRMQRRAVNAVHPLENERGSEGVSDSGGEGSEGKEWRDRENRRVTLLYWPVASCERSRLRCRWRRARGCRLLAVPSIVWLILFTCGRCSGGYTRAVIYQFVGPHCRRHGSLLIVGHSEIERSHLFLLRAPLSDDSRHRCMIPSLLPSSSLFSHCFDFSKLENIRDNRW